MIEVDAVFGTLGSYLPALITLAITAILVWLSRWSLLVRNPDLDTEARLPRQLLIGLLVLTGILTLLLTLPLESSTRGQVLSFLGVVMTGVIGLSATTFVSNGIAGVMLRIGDQFRLGDFIRLGNEFGRVTERGLLHVEIQTEDRDLTTFPNMYLITHPFTVVHRTGTIVSAEVSLGYEVPREAIETALKAAAHEAGLVEAFVQVTELGDHSVVYRVAGFLEVVKQVLTTRSNLRKAMMDALHAANIEIVSPVFMNQRPQNSETRVIPERTRVAVSEEVQSAPEGLIFDKADKAEELERLRTALGALQAELLEAGKQSRGKQAGHDRIDAEIAKIKSEIESMEVGSGNADDKPLDVSPPAEPAAKKETGK